MHDAEDLQNTDGVSIHDGFPNPATDARLRSLDLNQLLITHSASSYFFRVRGSEWEAVGVFDNDIAILDRALDPRTTDVVLWYHDESGEFALSRYKDLPESARLYGVITATIHQFRQIAKRPRKAT